MAHRAREHSRLTRTLVCHERTQLRNGQAELTQRDRPGTSLRRSPPPAPPGATNRKLSDPVPPGVSRGFVTQARVTKLLALVINSLPLGTGVGAESANPQITWWVPLTTNPQP